MLQGNQLEVALKAAGYKESKPKRNGKKNKRKIVCKKCGQAMVRHEATNVAVCENPECKGSSFFLMNHIN